jgi:hypothetical protein
MEPWETASTIVARGVAARTGFDIEAVVSVRLTSNGSERDVSDRGPDDWTGENAASCDGCGYSGTVKDFEPNPANTS